MGGCVNHYPHHIGDFNNATRHLTRVERSLYRDMIELYYDTEQPLNSDTNKVARRILASTEEERAAMALVLEEFFVLQDDGWHNARCDAEIAKYKGQIEQASRAGRASAAKRSNKDKAAQERPFNDRSTTVVAPLNQPEPEPRTNSVTEVTGGDAASDAEKMTKDELWSAGKSLLSKSMPKAQCGSFVGKLVKDYGDQVVVDAVRAAVVARPADPAEYLKAVCMRAKGERLPPNKQVAIEQRNQAAVDEWLQQQGVTHA